VVHVAMMTLVGQHVLEAVDPLRVVVELPVGLGDARRGEAVPLVVELRAWRSCLGDEVVIPACSTVAAKACWGGRTPPTLRLDRRLFEVAYETVHRTRMNRVGEREERRHAELGRHAERSGNWTCFEHLETYE